MTTRDGIATAIETKGALVDNDSLDEALMQTRIGCCTIAPLVLRCENLIANMVFGNCGAAVNHQRKECNDIARMHHA